MQGTLPQSSMCFMLPDWVRIPDRVFVRVEDLIGLPAHPIDTVCLGLLSSLLGDAIGRPLTSSYHYVSLHDNIIPKPTLTLVWHQFGAVDTYISYTSI